MTKICTVSVALQLLLLCLATTSQICLAVLLDCSPDQFEVDFRISSFAQSTATHGFGRLHVDRRVTNSTVMNMTMAGNNITETALYISNWSTNITYKWLPDTAQCSLWPLVCNRDFSYVNSVFLGADSDKMEARVFWASSGGNNVTLVVSKDLCIPLYISYQFAQGFSVTNFFNATMGIRDPDVFQVPDQCSRHPRQRRYISIFGGYYW